MFYVCSPLYADVFESVLHQSHAIKNRNLKTKKRKRTKEFDFSLYKTRLVALKIAYFGANYAGLAIQDNVVTVEKLLFDALLKTRLIKSRQSCQYSRYGRTDKGVSAFCQVVSLKVRSKRLACEKSDSELNPEDEMNYPLALNSCLPDDIRVVGWCPVPEQFNARFMNRTIYIFSFQICF